MKIDERLHDAMHEYADTIEPEPGSWSKIVARFDEEPAPRRSAHLGLVFAGVALTLIVALIAVLVARDDDNGTRIATGPATGMPPRILAVNESGHPVVLDAATGEQKAAYKASGVAEGVQIAAGPERDIYLVRGNGNEGCSEHTLVRLPLADGAGIATLVSSNATDPTVSPDGRYLAYLHCLPGDNRAVEIVLRDLTTGEQRVTAAPAGTSFISHAEFAADSHHVFVALFDDKVGNAAMREIDIVGGQAAPGRELGVAAGGQGWVGVRGTTGEYLGVKGTPPSVLNLTEVGRDPTGFSFFSAGRLFTVPTTPTQVVSDRSGRHILAVVDHALYRWSEGEKEATRIADGVIGAAWIPDAPAPAPIPVDRPGALVAAVDGNRLAFLASANGSEQKSFGSFLGISSVSVTPNGKEILFSSATRSGACGSGPASEVDRLNTDTLSSTPIVGYAVTPLVSPDGRYVAYGITCDGPALGLTNLATGQNYRTDPLGGRKSETSANIESVEVLGWSPDSTRMLYRLMLKGDSYPRYYVGRLWPAVRQSETKVIELPSGSNVGTAAFVDDDTVAMAIVTGRPTHVYEMPIKPKVLAKSDGDVKWVNQTLLVTGDAMFEAPGPITSLVADPSGRHFLALVTRPRTPPVPGIPTGSNLYRWSVGDPAPTKIADSVTAASWAP